MIRPRRSTLLAAPLAGLLLLLASAPSSVAAPPKKQKQCIASAETGQQLRASGKLVEARKAFGACTQAVCPAIIRRDCGRWIEEIDSATPTVTVKLEDEAGSDVPDGTVLIDGEPLLRAEGRATPLDPGVHKFVWSRDAGAIEQELVVREGEHNRVIVLRASSRSAVAPPPSASASGAEPTESPRRRSVLPFVLGGLGIAVGGTGAIMWGVGLGQRSTLESSCVAAHACTQHDVNASRTNLLIGDVLVGVGVVALAGALFLLVRDGGSPPTTTATR